jgi:hypothetical protein
MLACPMARYHYETRRDAERQYPHRIGPWSNGRLISECAGPGTDYISAFIQAAISCGEMAGSSIVM